MSDDVQPMSDDVRRVTTDLKKYEERVKNSHTYQFIDRTMSFFVSAFAFISWSSWYHFCHGFGAFENLQRLLVFTAIILVVLILLIILHFRNKRRLEESAEMDSDVVILDSKTTAALVEKTFGNVTDAMGYVLVEAWTLVYPLPNGGLGKDTASFMSCVFVVGIFTFVLEFIERSMRKGSTIREVFDLLGQVVISAGSWFITDPAVVWFKELFKVPDKEAAPLWVGLIAAVGSIILLICLNCFLAKFLKCKACEDDEESDDESADEIFLEKVMFLFKQASFYTSGRLIKGRILATPFAQEHAGWTVLLFIAFSVITVLMLEAVSSARQLPDEPSVQVFWLKIRGETIALYIRVTGWISSGLLSHALNWRADKKRWNALYAIVSQFIALAIDQCRVQRLSASLAKEAALQDKLMKKIKGLGPAQGARGLGDRLNGMVPVKGGGYLKFLKGRQDSEDESSDDENHDA